MTARPIVIGTRGSELALWQARWVENHLREAHPSLAVRQSVIRTTGDRILDASLSAIGDKGLFIKELENALLAKTIDLAVHSLKDVPTRLPEGLALGAISERDDVRDVFIAQPRSQYRRLADVPSGATVATGSLRRRSQLLRLMPQLRIEEIRGNLNTRFEKLNRSDWAGMLLARAGVVRLGKEHTITEVLPADVILPAVGQGALGIEIRQDDAGLMELLQPLNHTETMQGTLAERSLLRKLGGGCRVPIGAYGRIENGRLVLDAFVGSLDGKQSVRGTIIGSPGAADELGAQLANRLLKDGAQAILAEIIRSSR